MSFPYNPHISVILPVRNGLPYLKEAIGGICAQTYKNFTLIVQDGLSTDGSLDYLKSLQTDFPVEITSEHDGSIAKAYALAMKRAKGDLVVAAACDEIFDADAFAQYVAWFRERPDAVFIYGGSRLFTGQGDDKKIVSIFQPPEFNFLDYVRQRMCPTVAGGYNRFAAGEALLLDESLKTVPDFELITRLALTFGPEKIITRRAITMSARADAVSTSFRPEAHMQITKDKATILARLFSGPLREKMLSLLHRDFAANLHISSANIIYDIEGGSAAYAAQVEAAAQHFPQSELVGTLAHQARELMWDEVTDTISRITPPPPEAPDPARAKVKATVPLNQFMMSEAWAARGAKVSADGAGGIIVDTAWYMDISTVFPVDVSALDFEKNWYWLHVAFTPLQGLPTLVLGGSFAQQIKTYSNKRVMFSRKFQAPEPAQSLSIFMKPCRSAFFAVANATTECQSRIALSSIAILEVPKE